jgi:hypothetical protein
MNGFVQISRGLLPEGHALVEDDAVESLLGVSAFLVDDLHRPAFELRTAEPQADGGYLVGLVTHTDENGSVTLPAFVAFTYTAHAKTGEDVCRDLNR